jgi:uncharacterized protein
MITVTDVPSRSRYEAKLDGETVGFVSYRAADDQLLLTHAEVDPSLRGRGLGEQVVRATLDQVRDRDAKVVPLCGFVHSVMRDNPEYHALMQR